MPFEPALWHRLEFDGLPIYLRRDTADWFVPNRAGDKLLQAAAKGGSPNGDPVAARFLARLPQAKAADYRGRITELHLDRLSHLWFHLTNRCNLSCRHCLFASSPKDRAELDAGRVFNLADQAYRLGCRVFALTGGEPLVHSGIAAVIGHLLGFGDTRVVVLTNGMALAPVLSAKGWDMGRLSLQISIDGLEPRHDALRGRGSFQKLVAALGRLRRRGLPFTLSMCVTGANVADMDAMPELAASLDAGNLHFMWHLRRGRGTASSMAPVEVLSAHWTKAAERASACGIRIDNLAALRTQVFAPAGTLHDGTTAGWQSAAVGPDGQLYPSAALVGMVELAADLGRGLEAAWRHSAVMKKIREATIADDAAPLRFVTGGGDLDHSYVCNRTFMGDDPYLPVYEKMALRLIAAEAGGQPADGPPGLRLRMGEILESCGAHGRVALVHPNCLLATAENNSLTIVKEYYRKAAGDRNADILNPICYDQDRIDHIPAAFRFRGYGCGSPVLDAGIGPGQRVADLGCGAGVECFIAARLTGPSGKVWGVDMLEPMLALAEQAKVQVAQTLGYDNVVFKKGLLEALPLETASVDVVISNCVMNLSAHKRRSYREIWRVLRPGGRLVIADVVCESEPDPSMRNDEVLRGQCIAGALTQGHLMALLEETGFSAICLLKRFVYRTVNGHPFFSITYEAVKPKAGQPVRVVWRGPSPLVILDNATVLMTGMAAWIGQDQAERLGDQVFVLDAAGRVTNMGADDNCRCGAAPAAGLPAKDPPPPKELSLDRQRSGCMVCGAVLRYFPTEQVQACTYCGRRLPANAVCQNGHFVCDACHSRDAMKVIAHLCRTTAETDMIQLLATIRRHPAIPVHGPEHHGMTAGIILAAYRNRGGRITDSQIKAGLERGQTIAGGACGFMGVCGAAAGVGIAFSLILDANPLRPAQRAAVQQAAQAALGDIAAFDAARCCQREMFLALRRAADLSARMLPVALQAEGILHCRQQQRNPDCIGQRCPVYRQDAHDQMDKDHG